MFKDHPKGLFVAFFANMGERFGFYTMMAILVLFLQARYDLSAEAASGYYSWFYYAIYALALFGGILADSTSKYKLVILFGIIIMFVGYAVIAIPGMPLYLTLIGLFVIAFGNGLFKGNLQAVVGQLYDDPKYSKLRDTAFMIFYMGINVGAFFAPFVATGVRNWFLKTQGFAHDGSLPAMCHAYLNGRMTDSASIASLESLAGKVSNAGGLRRRPAQGIRRQLHQRLLQGVQLRVRPRRGSDDHLAAGLHRLQQAPAQQGQERRPKRATESRGSAADRQPAQPGHRPGVHRRHGGRVPLRLQPVRAGHGLGLFLGFVAFIFKTSTKEEKPRVVALVLVFFVVIFFWMSFHQNGLTQTFFARDYTVKEVGPILNIFFNLNSLLAFIGCIAGLILLITKKKPAQKTIGLAMFAGLGALTYYFVSGYQATNPIAPEIFQSFNPLFIVALTFPVMGIFTWLRNRNSEPSTPRKIGIGMVIAAVGFVVMLVASLQLAAPRLIASENMTEWGRVSPSWLISSYLILTIAELFLSPMGISFVSKVSPLRFQGLMQGGWLLATATGNKLLFVGGYFWDKIELWQLWAIFVVCCLLSATFIFSIMKRLERTTKS